MSLSDQLRVAADACDDSHDHDELHAAAEVILLPGAIHNEYIQRWVFGLIKLHKITASSTET